MGEFDQVKPYTQAELDQQAIWANEFDQWWESEGQYHRAGGNEYCRTFAWWAWLNREQWQQSKIEQLEKELAQMKHINDEQYKNLKTAFKTIHIQRKFDADSRGTIACLTEMNGRLEKRIAEALKILKDWDDQTYHDDIEQLTGELTDTLRGES